MKLSFKKAAAPHTRPLWRLKHQHPRGDGGEWTTIHGNKARVSGHQITTYAYDPAAIPAMEARVARAKEILLGKKATAAYNTSMGEQKDSTK